MKLIALYLPQFHEIPENNDAWGNGFTEWTNVKKSEPLFLGHRQPRVPMENRYYNLMDSGVQAWQAQLAKRGGVSGFCFYHYWFNGRMVLEGPAEQLLAHPEIEMPFCFSWANESWTKTWHGAGGAKEILIAQTYGGQEEWERHYQYFRRYFQDPRYIKENNRPMVLICHLKDIPQFNGMIRYWNERAREDGFDGIFLLTMTGTREHVNKSRWVDGSVDFEPNLTKSKKLSEPHKIQPKDGAKLKNYFAVKRISYDRLNREMLAQPHGKNCFRTVFVDYDDSPRRKYNAVITMGSTPDKFSKYLKKAIELSRLEGNEYIFINAWNEWGEGNYLEPDEEHQYGYLDAVRKALEESGSV